MEKTKTGLLKKYDQKKPNLFIQYDGFSQEWCDGVVKADDDGYCVMFGLTYELMGGSCVRVLIEPKASKEDVLVLLDKIKKCIKKDKYWQFEAKKELNKFNKLKEIENESQKISENGYTLDDIEYLFDSIKVMRDKKKQAEEIPF